MPTLLFDPLKDLHKRQQDAFFSKASEMLYGGAAGGGKSHLMRYSALVAAIYCPGIQVYLFRRTYPDLMKNHMEGPTSFPVVLSPLINKKLATINHGSGVISFANGSRIFLCHCQHEKNVHNYQGAEIHLLLIDELTHFTDTIYRYLRGRCRLGSWKAPKQMQGVFPRIINGSNPGGVGHNWVKAMFVTAAAVGKVWKTPREEGGMRRQFIQAKLSDNPTMEENDPEYKDRLYGLGAKDLVDAMLDGNWDIVSGGAIDDVWNAARHMIEPFVIPQGWYVDRSFDWGSTKPFSVGWWAISNGEDVQTKSGAWRWFPPGSVIRIAEWYGCKPGKPDHGLKMLAADIAKGILKREEEMGLHVRPGPADSSIFTEQNGNCIATDMSDNGVTWVAANKGPGSRINGLEKVRGMLSESSKQYPESPGLYAFNTCHEYRRTIPVLPRDKIKLDDVDTKSEDHIYDDVRYRVNTPTIKTTVQEV